MKLYGAILLSAMAVSSAYAADDVVGAVHGVIEKIDPAAKTLLVKASDGTEHSVHFLDSTAVHSAHVTKEVAADSWHGLKKGSEVVVHYTKRGSEETAGAIDKIGDDGLKESKGAVESIDRTGKTMTVKTEDGAKTTFQMTDDAAKTAGKDISKDSEKGAHVTVYYSEKAGKKIAHFFE